MYRIYPSLTFTAIAMFLGLAMSVHGATLMSLEPLAEDLAAGANSVTPDGRYVVGGVVSANQYSSEVIRWSRNGTQVSSLRIGPTPNYFQIDTNDLSDDGQAIIGTLRAGPIQAPELAFRWTSSSGVVPLGDLFGGQTESYALGISGDGAVVVGGGSVSTGWGTSGWEAFRWTNETGMVGLGDLPGGVAESGARAISRDGTTIVGYSVSDAGAEGFVWTASEGMQGLGMVPGSYASSADAVNSDGSIVVGSSSLPPFGIEAFRWTKAGGIVGLGDLPGGEHRSVGTGVSDDGRIIVGAGYSESGEEATLWINNGSPLRLWDYLVARNIDPSVDGWEVLSTAAEVSPDGKVIVGRGRRYGRNMGFVVEIPEPTAATLAVTVCIAGALSRLRRSVGSALGSAVSRQ